MNLVLGLAGGWFAFDGVYSIIRYEKQSWFEQTIRVVRIIGGLA